jgi:hypothetical protein
VVTTAKRWDVVLVSDRVRAGDIDGCFSNHPPVDTRVDLAPGLWVGPVDERLHKLVLRACSQESNVGEALYAYVQEDPAGFEWDPTDTLSKAVGLSHFVRATETAFEFSATVRLEAGVPAQAQPANRLTPYLKAWCATDRHRRWLTTANANLLRDLIAAHAAIREELRTSKTGRAITVFAQTPYLYDAHVRGLTVACTLESLVNSGPERSTAQFVRRVPLLAAALGIPGVDKPWAEKAYAVRSALAHGGNVVSPLKGGLGVEVEFDRLVARMEDIVRDALRRALLDATWRAILDNPQDEWPIPAAACAVCRGPADPSAFVPVRCGKCGREL